jgi:DNA (cytosine-5)-methyltransferase 1
MVRQGADMAGEISPTLRAEAHAGDNAPHVLIIDGRRTDDVRVNEGIVHTLEARMGTGGNNVPMVAETTSDVIGSLQERSYKGPNHENARDGQLVIVKEEAFGLQGTMINRQDHNGPSGQGVSKPGEPMYTLTSTDVHAVATPQMTVRRLTPIECERLMGWPDDHTLYRADGKTNADSTRYKMCGNGVASPVAEWIGRNLLEKGF